MTKVIKQTAVFGIFAGVGVVSASADTETTNTHRYIPKSTLEITNPNKEFSPTQIPGQEIPDSTDGAEKKDIYYENPTYPVFAGKQTITVEPKTEGETVKYRFTATGVADGEYDESLFTMDINKKNNPSVEYNGKLMQNAFNREDVNLKFKTAREEIVELPAGEFEFGYYYNGFAKGKKASVKVEKYDKETDTYTTVYEQSKDIFKTREVYSESISVEKKNKVYEVGGYSTTGTETRTTPKRIVYEADPEREGGTREKVQDGRDKIVEVKSKQAGEQYAKGTLRFDVRSERKTLDEFRKDPEVRANLLATVDLTGMNKAKLDQLAEDIYSLRDTAKLTESGNGGDDVRIAFLGGSNTTPHFSDKMTRQMFDVLRENLKSYQGDYSADDIINYLGSHGFVYEAPNPSKSDVEQFKDTMIKGDKVVTGVVHFSTTATTPKEIKDFAKENAKMLYNINYNDNYVSIFNDDKTYNLKRTDFYNEAGRKAVIRTDVNAYLYGEKPQMRFELASGGARVEYVKYFDANGTEHQLHVDNSSMQTFNLPNSVEGLARIEYKLVSQNSNETVYYQASVYDRGYRKAYHTEELRSVDSNPIETVKDAGQDEVWKVGTKTKVVEEEINYNTVEEKDPTKPVGYSEVKTPGKKGKKTITTTYELNTENGTVTPHENVVTEDAVDEVIIKGSAPNKVINSPDEFVRDDELEGGKIVEIQKGEPDVIDSDGKVIKKGKPRIVKVGTKPKVTKEEDIDFNVVNEVDATKPVGTKIVKQVGKKGKRTTTTHYSVDEKTGEVVTKEVVTEEKAVDEINVIGTGENTIRELPVEYIEDNTLEGGKIEEIRKGKPEIVDVTGKVVEEGVSRQVKVGTKSKVTKEEDIDFKVVNEEDDTRIVGTRIVKQIGKKGKRTITTYYTLDKQTGEVTTRDEVTEEKAVDEINIVGTKAKKELDQSTDYVEDPYIDSGKTIIVQEGSPAEVDSDGKVIKPAIPRIVKVGTKPLVKEAEIDFKVITNVDKTKPVGYEKIEVAGKKGKKITTTTYTVDKLTGELVSNVVETEEKPVDEVRTVGGGENIVKEIETKYVEEPTLRGGVMIEVDEGKAEIVDTKGNVIQKGSPRIVKIGSKPKVIEEEINYGVKHVEDETLPLGEKVLKQKGVKGKKVYKTTYTVNTEKGRVIPKEEVIETKHIDEIYAVGTGKNTVVELPTDYREDKDLEGGKVVESSKGRPEVKDATGKVIEKGERRIVKVGTKPKVSNVEETDYEVITKEDSKKPIGTTTVVQTGRKGKKVTTTYYKLDKVTGKITTEDKVEEIKSTPEIREVGTGADVKTDLPVEYIEDNTLEAGKQVVVIEGKSQVKDVTGKVLDKGVVKVVKVGTKPKVVDVTEIDFKVINKDDSTLEIGKSEIVTKGVKGKLTKTIYYKLDKKTGKLIENVVENKVEPINEVRKVGTKKTEQPKVDEKPKSTELTEQTKVTEQPKGKQLPETGSRELGLFGLIGLSIAGLLGLRRKEK